MFSNLIKLKSDKMEIQMQIFHSEPTGLTPPLGPCCYVSISIQCHGCAGHFTLFCSPLSFILIAAWEEQYLQQMSCPRERGL